MSELTQGQRLHCIIDIQDCIRGALAAAGIEGVKIREARLNVAASHFQRDVTSYNDLSSTELFLLWNWVKANGLELKAFLEMNYAF